MNEVNIKVKNLNLEIPLLQSNRIFEKSRNFASDLIGSTKIIGDKKSDVQSKILDNLTFTINTGDVVALLGHNGSGKTSLLRLLCGIYEKTSGTLEINGSISPHLGMSSNINQDLTGYDNIKVFWLLMNKSLPLEKLISDIEEHTELGEFLHLPLKIYSSGMEARFLFSISTFIKTDILLSDEQLSAGDYFFQEKAKLLLERFYENNKIKSSVSHNMQFVKENCNKALVMKKGRGIFFDDIDEAVKFYKSQEYIVY